jgi:hypothetical protein
VATSATVLLAVASACTKSPTAPPPGLHRAQLLALASNDSVAPITPVFFTFHNNQVVNPSLLDSDSAGTVYATFHFISQSIRSRNDSILADTSTVTVQVDVLTGQFGFVIGPPNLFFNTAGSPTVDLSYTKSADFSVFDSSSRYASPTDFEQALELWYEYGADQWRPTRNSAHSAPHVISAALEQPGTYLVAARK